MRQQKRIQLDFSTANANHNFPSWIKLRGLVTLFVVCFAFSGCIAPSIHEGNFIPNPAGDRVASIYSSSLPIVIFPLAEPIGSSAGVWLVRETADGKQLLEIHEYSYKDRPAWSQDGRWLAFPDLTRLTVCDTKTGVVKKVCDGEVGSIAWTENGCLRYVRFPDEVWQFQPTDSANNRVLCMGYSDTECSPDILRERSRLSPDGRFCAGVTPSKIVFFDLDRSKAVRSVPNPGFHKGMGFVDNLNWSHNNQFCLFTYLPGDERYGVAGDRSEHLAVYDLERGMFMDLKIRLPQEEKPDGWHAFSLSRDCWSADDRCFTAEIMWMTGISAKKFLLCQLEPWSTVCLEDHFGGDLHQVRLAIRGNFIAVARKTGEQGIYVAEITSTPDGLLSLGPATKVWSSIPTGWFWSPTEPQLVVFNKGRYETIDVRTSITSVLPATHSPSLSP